MLPKRKKPSRSGIKRVAEKRFPAHLKWVRGFSCAVEGAFKWTTVECGGGIEAAHVRGATDGSMGKKPSDFWVIPLCAQHHAQQHTIGESGFERMYSVDMKKLAEELASKSPHRHLWEDGDGH